MTIHTRIGLLALVSVSFLQLPALAAGPPVAAAGADALEEVTVTAQRRSENLERVAVAVSVISGDSLTKQAIVSESDLRSAVPGVIVRASLGSNQLNYSIRGQTVDAFSGSTPAVLPYINEVKIGGYGSSSAFYDLDSVQVLKGPQGTLFGKNATGGAVLFTTHKPSDKLEGYISGSAGNYSLKQAEGALNLPIVVDHALARVAAFYQKRDGYQFNTFTSTNQGDVDRHGVRGSLTLKGDRIKNELVIDYAHATGTSMGLALYSVAPQFSNAAPIPANLLYTPFLDVIFKAPGTFAAFAAGNPKTPPGGIYDFLAIQRARGPFIISDNNPNAHQASNTLLSNITTVNISDNLQFKNVLGYNSLHSLDGDDADGTPYGIDGTPTGQKFGFDNTTKEFSEEPQLIGKAMNGKLTYVTGLYFSNDKTTSYTLSSFVDLTPLPGGAPAAQHNDTETKDRSYAGYFQGTYDLSTSTGVDGLGVTAGARYTSEKITETQLQTSSFFGAPAPFQMVLEKTFSKPSWQLGLQRQVNPGLLLYLVSRQSFRSGGFNTVAPPVPGFGNNGGSGFDAETATDLELGLKFQGDLAGMPARLNLAAYTEQIKKIQRVAYTIVAGAPAGLTTNVPKTRVNGLEVEGLLNPTRWLKLGLTFAYADAKFTDNLVTVAGAPPVTVGYGPYPDTPKTSASLFSEVTVPVGNNLDFSVRGDVYNQSKIYFSSTNDTLTPGTELPGYTIANFQLSLESRSSGWAVSANLKNAFNRVYYVGGLGALNVFTVNSVIPGDPRTVLATLRYKF